MWPSGFTGEGAKSSQAQRAGKAKLIAGANEAIAELKRKRDEIAEGDKRRTAENGVPIESAGALAMIDHKLADLDTVKGLASADIAWQLAHTKRLRTRRNHRGQVWCGYALAKSRREIPGLDI
jgi:hypothetical protein